MQKINFHKKAFFGTIVLWTVIATAVFILATTIRYPAAFLSCLLIGTGAAIQFIIFRFMNCAFSRLSQQCNELLKSKEYLETVFANLPIIATVSELETGEFININKTFSEISGYTTDDLLGFKSTDVEWLSETQRNDLLAHIRKNGLLTNYEIRVRSKNGKTMWGLYFGKVIEFANTKYLISLAQDISKDKVTEENMKEIDSRYRALIELSPDSIFLHNGTYFLYANNAACQLLKAPNVDNILNTKVIDVVHPDCRLLVEERIHTMRRENSTALAMSERLLCFDGSYVDVEVIAAPCRISGENAYQVIARDITERLLAESALKQSLKEKEALIQELFHRTKNNLQVISGILQLSSSTIQDKKLQQFFDETTYRIKTMALMHQQLISSADLSRINLREYFENIISLFTNLYYQVSQHVTIESHLDDVFTVIDYAAAGGLLLGEILSNVFKHAFPGSRKGLLKIELHRIDNRIQIVVEDDGIGLDEEFNAENSDSIGIRLINLTVEHQLSGQIRYAGPPGTQITIDFEDNKYFSRI
ncbi:MAG: PAS domain S-box protein [Ignavibacteria bacterium]|nr:PAS domain S-box protein [Ignavibacteria bacterium]